MWEGVEDGTELQHIDPHSIGHNRVSFPFFWAAQPGAWGPSLSGCWFSLPHLISNSSDPQLIWSPTATAQTGAWGPILLGAGFLYRILSPTDWISCALSYIIVQCQPSSCGRHKLHSFNPSTVNVIPDAPVIYTGAFPILIAQPGRWSICSINIYILCYLKHNMEFHRYGCCLLHLFQKTNECSE